MSTATAQRKSLIQRVAAKREKSTQIVSFVGNTGEIPLEHRGEIDRDDKDSNGIVLKKIRFRNLKPGAGGREEFNMAVKADADMVKRLRDWIDDHESGVEPDPRIDEYGIRELEPNRPTPPFANFSGMKPDILLGFIAAQLTENDDSNRRLLEKCAVYELDNKNRDEVLAGLDILGSASDDDGSGIAEGLD